MPSIRITGDLFTAPKPWRQLFLKFTRKENPEMPNKGWRHWFAYKNPEPKEAQTMARLKLGMKVRDVLTGVEGVLMSRVTFLTGCDRYAVQPQGIDDRGRAKEGEYFDENRLEIIDANPIRLVGEVEVGEGTDSPPPG